MLPRPSVHVSMIGHPNPFNDAEIRHRAGDERYLYLYWADDDLHGLQKLVHTGEHWNAGEIVAQSRSLSSLSAAARLLSGAALLELETKRLDAELDRASARRHAR